MLKANLEERMGEQFRWNPSVPALVSAILVAGGADIFGVLFWQVERMGQMLLQVGTKRL